MASVALTCVFDVVACVCVLSMYYIISARVCLFRFHFLYVTISVVAVELYKYLHIFDTGRLSNSL